MNKPTPDLKEETPSEIFWKMYEEANELDQPKYLKTLTRLKDLRHPALPKNEGYAVTAFHSYLQDYKEYIERHAVEQGIGDFEPHKFVSKKNPSLVIELRGDKDKRPECWAILNNGLRLSRTGKWDHEPMPSSRSDEWIANHSFTFEEAVARAEEGSKNA